MPADVGRFLKALDAPKLAGPQRYVYVVEVATFGVKVGITSDPRRRLPQLRREAAGYGFDLGRLWLSRPDSRARRVEEYLIRLGGATNKREYLTLPFEQVVTYAEKLLAPTPVPPTPARKPRPCAGCGAVDQTEDRDDGTYVRTDHTDDCPVMYGGALPTHCAICGTELLNPHNLVGLCKECAYCARTERLTAETASIYQEVNR